MPGALADLGADGVDPIGSALLLCIQATVGDVHEAKVTEEGARVTFCGVRVTRMLLLPTLGTGEGDVAGDVGTENWLGRGARPRHGSKVSDAVTERESHPTAGVLRPSCSAGRSAISPDGWSIAVVRPVIDASVAPNSPGHP